MTLASHDGPGWAVYDTRDHLWLGDDQGPLVYPEEDLAHLAASVLATRLKMYNRLEARAYSGGATRKRDKLKPVRSTEEALRLLEDGRAL